MYIRYCSFVPFWRRQRGDRLPLIGQSRLADWLKLFSSSFKFTDCLNTCTKVMSIFGVGVSFINCLGVYSYSLTTFISTKLNYYYVAAIFYCLFFYFITIFTVIFVLWFQLLLDFLGYAFDLHFQIWLMSNCIAKLSPSQAQLGWVGFNPI